MKRFLLGILAGIVIAGVALVVLMFAAVRWSAQAPSVPASGILTMNLSGEVPEGLAEVPPIPALPVRRRWPWSSGGAYCAQPGGRAVKGLLLRPRQ